MASQQLLVAGGNLFQIALQYLGDATQWNRIAELSLTGPDPFLPSGVLTTLTIPARTSVIGDGVYTPNAKQSSGQLFAPALLLTDDAGNTLSDSTGSNLISGM